jgi:histone deacetylase HOS3
MAGKSPLAEEDIEPPRPRHTAASIASTHFKTELELHNKEDELRPTYTLVILHDSCYGHRYSRPRTSKASLSTIVERPERIHASILGLSVAYVRLGERHAEGQYPLHPAKDPSAIPNTPFRIRKTVRRLPLSSQAVTNVHGAKWMEELKIMCDNAEAKLAMNGKELTRPDMSRSPDQGAPAKLHEGDLYLCSESLNAMEGALGAVCEGVDAVFQGSASGKGPHRTFVAIRPPGHHCSASYPSGFCWLNNVHVGISHAALTHGLTHAAIIDFDLHHGDGSQAIAWEHNRRATNLPKNALPWKKTSIGYFSLHDINSYPCEMGDEEKVKNASLCIENAHGQSIWNVHLQPWKSEAEFWELYENKYSILLEKTRNFLRAQTDRLRSSPNGPKPKAAIFLSAGFDASEWESSGMQRHKVNVPTEFYARFTRDVVKLAAEEGTAVEGRVISVLEGGYSDRALCTGVFGHISGMASGSPIVIQKEANHVGLGYEMGQKIGAFNGSDKSTAEPVTTGTQNYDPSWWSLPQLEQLDATVRPPPPAAEPKKPKDGTAPTYSTPTQSFIAKVTFPSARRSVSNMSSTIGSPKPVTRPPSPPPPDVDWTVAAHELSKLLIPTDRQTMSCKQEDLSAEATRARRDRQSILTSPTSASEPVENPSTRMALRARKPAKPVIETVEEDEAKKPAVKASRRKTVAGAAVIAAEKVCIPNIHFHAITFQRPNCISNFSNMKLTSLQATSRSATPSSEPSYTKPTSQSSRRLSLASTTGSVTSDDPRPNGHNRVPSNGPTTYSHRPGTAQSVRPDSSMSSRGHSIPPVVVKKTRAPAQPRAEPAKTSRVRRKSPLHDSGATAAGSDTTVEPPSRSTSVSGPPSEPSKPQDSDIHNLTSGMKKIKLNLTTKAQREAREQAKQAAKEVAGKPATKSAAGRTGKTRPVEKPVENAPAPGQPRPEPALIKTALPPMPQPQVEFLPPVPSISQPFILPVPPHIPSHIEHATEIPLPASSPPAPPSFNTPFSQPLPVAPLPPAPAPRTDTSSDVFIPYQPEGPQPDAFVQQEPLRWLPPNTSTPSPMKKGELPVFTSTSAIPFGINHNLAGAGGQQVNSDSKNVKMEEGSRQEEIDIWEVPETPQK